VPRLVEALAGKKVVGAAAGGGHTALWTEDGKVFTFGDFFARTVSKRLAMQGAEVHPAPAHPHTNGEFGALGHKFALNFHKSRNFAWHFSVNRRKGLLTLGEGDDGMLDHGGAHSEPVQRLVEALVGKQVVSAAAGQA